MTLIEANNQNYTLGRGELFAARLETKRSLPKRYFKIASTTAFTLNLEPEELEHVNSDCGVRTVDDTVVINRGFTGTIETDDIHAENMALFLYGNASELSQAQVVKRTTAARESFASIKPGDVLQLGVDATRIPGVQALNSNPADATLRLNANSTEHAIAVDTRSTFNPASIDDTASPPTGQPNLEEDTHFEVDYEAGLIEFFADQPTGSPIIAAGVGVHVWYAAPAVKRTRVVAGLTPIRAGLMFVQCNSEGTNRIYTIPQTIVRANGDMALKGEEWRTIPLTFEGVDRGAGSQMIYIDNLPD